VGEFRLQVGDVIVNFDPIEDFAFLNGWSKLRVVKVRQNYAKVLSGWGYATVRLSELSWQMKRVHRPTPSGMVQVWPEEHDPD
jgi:hypothetical protein